MPVLAFAQVHPPCTNCRPNADKVNEKKTCLEIFFIQPHVFKAFSVKEKENPGSKRRQKSSLCLTVFVPDASICRHLID